MAAKKSAKKPAAKSRGANKPAKAIKAKKATQATKATKAKKAISPAKAKGSSRRPAPKSKVTKASAGRKAVGGPAKKRAPLKSRRPVARPKRPAAPKAKSTLAENPEALALARTIAHVAAEKKATDVVIIDTRARGSAVGYDYVVIATGDSDRQLEAVATAVDEALRPQGTKAASVEASSDWVLANYHDVVAHFFTPDTRGTYDLEGLWSDAPRVPLE